MNRNMKVLLIGAALMLFVVGGTIWQVIEVNQSGRSPLTVLFEEDEQSATPEPTPVTIILRDTRANARGNSRTDAGAYARSRSSDANAAPGSRRNAA